jgi:3-oxo-5-alpha-steroid 4-dehydrogenase 1
VERLLESESTSGAICWLVKIVILQTNRWILSSPRYQKLPSSFLPAHRLSSCSLPASDGCHRYVSLSDSQIYASHPTTSMRSVSSPAITHLVITTVILYSSICQPSERYTPEFILIQHHFQQFSLLSWTPLGNYQYMGKTSTDSRFNLPSRYAWCAAELVGPLNLLFIVFTLPSKLHPPPNSGSSILSTGLSAKNELLAALYVLHYINRAVVSPLFLAPSMSPLHASMAALMAIFQYVNSACIASWLVYSSLTPSASSFSPLTSLIGLVIFFLGMAGNIASENELFALRRGAAKRKAKSEGKAHITYDKVYVIPPATGWFKYILSPHYVLEWFEWTGYWILGGGLGLGWNTPALWFLINELVAMSPRAVRSRKWYEKKFGKRAVAGRGGFAPAPWL